MKRNWERLDSLVWRIEGRGEIWFKSGKSYMDMNHVDKNKWFSSAYVPGENERQTRMSSDTLNLLCTPKYEETFLVQELSIYGMIFHMKSKVLETWKFSKTSLITGWIPERSMKSEKRCFKLAHPWYININTPIKLLRTSSV